MQYMVNIERTENINGMAHLLRVECVYEVECNS